MVEMVLGNTDLEGGRELKFKITQANTTFPTEKITEKQKHLIINMIHALELDTDVRSVKYMTKEDAWAFIQKYNNEYKVHKLLNGGYTYSSHRHTRGRKHVDCNPFAGPHECDYMDCYDFGITPWGDS